MKSVVTFFPCFLWLSLISWANNNPYNNVCTSAGSEGSELIKKQLLAGTWATSNNVYKDRFIFEFNAGGDGHLVEYDYPGARRYRTYSWTLQASGTAIQLELDFHQGNEKKTYKVNAQEEQLVFTDLKDNDNLSLRHLASKSKETWQRIANGLQGRWENASYAMDKPSESGLPVTQDISLSFDFAEGGAYERIVANNVKTRKETGTWELSKDGQYIFFHAKDRRNCHVVRIKFIEGDELVLEQIDAGQEKVSSKTKVRDYFFNKI